MTYYALLLLSLLTLAGCAPAEPAAPAESATPPSKTTAPASPPEPVISAPSLDASRRALAAYGAGDEAEALACCDEALALSADNYEALALKGLITAFSDPEAGAALIGQALALRPDYVQGFYNMAMALKLGGRYEESIRYFHQVLAADPHNAWSLYGIATNYADLGNREEALSYLSRAIGAGGEAVKDAASVQDHFRWLRGDEEFEHLIA